MNDIYLYQLSNLTYITRLNTTSISSDVYYHLEYTRDTSIDEYTVWRSYRLLNNKQENIQLNPPIIAKPYSIKYQTNTNEFLCTIRIFRMYIY